MEHKPDSAFAVWITGLPASGKSSVTRSLRDRLAIRNIPVVVLESDELRRILTEHAQYTDEERDLFYRQMAAMGALLVKQGVSVIFDATATSRIYRERAKQQIARFLEVYVECPLEVCMARDPKGIYRRAREGKASHVPGVQTVYEPPENPDVVVRGDEEPPEMAARRIMGKLEEKSYLRREA